MDFTWDPAKNATNRARHGIDFSDAVRIFDRPTLERVDDRFDYGDLRVYAVGVVDGVEVTVVYTDVAERKRRIISAWRAERHEREAYWNSVG